MKDKYTKEQKAMKAFWVPETVTIVEELIKLPSLPELMEKESRNTRDPPNSINSTN